LNLQHLFLLSNNKLLFVTVRSRVHWTGFALCS